MTLASFLKGYQPNVEPRVAFWSHEGLWPDDAPNYVFAARAVRALGNLRYGTNWSDDIPASPMLFELPTDYSIYTPIEDIRRAITILGNIASNYSNRPREQMATLLTMGTAFPTPEEWVEAVAEAKSQSDRFWARYTFFYRTALELSHACKVDKIKSATRPFSGGEPIIRPWHFWNMERSWIRFDTCRVDPNDDFAATPFTEPGNWLFFEVESFERYKAGDGGQALQAQPVREDIEAAKRSRPRGRKRGDQIDIIAGRFTAMVRAGEVNAESSVRDIARQLADFAAMRFEQPYDEGYIRERLTFWFSEVFPREQD